MTPSARTTAWMLAACAVALAACRCEGPGLEDAGADAGPGVDAGPDAGGVDAGSNDAGSDDAGAPDAGETDAGLNDAGPDDAGSLDAGETDAGAPDAGAIDAGTCASPCMTTTRLPPLSGISAGVSYTLCTPGDGGECVVEIDVSTLASGRAPMRVTQIPVQWSTAFTSADNTWVLDGSGACAAPFTFASVSVQLTGVGALRPACDPGIDAGVMIDPNAITNALHVCGTPPANNVITIIVSTLQQQIDSAARQAITQALADGPCYR